jgi:LEA14-like dessication related protein
MRHRLTRALAVGWALAAVGCFGNVQPPQVRVDGLRLGGLGLGGGLLYVRLMVANPNGFDVRASGLTYSIEMRDSVQETEQWLPFADGSYTNDIDVLGHDSTMVEVPVTFRYDAMGDALRRVLQFGVLDYRVHGAVHLQRPISRSIPFRRSGTLAVGSS